MGANFDPFIFTWSLGDESDKYIPLYIACDNSKDFLILF